MSTHVAATPAKVADGTAKLGAPEQRAAVARSAAGDRTAGDRTVGQSAGGARGLAVLRVGVGFLLFWAFIDKAFGLGYSTTRAQAWIHGGSPTLGFLKSVDAGPAQSLMHAMAGTWYANWLFMLGLLGVGVAVMLGIALRPAAVAGVVLLGLMWLAEFPPARFATGGAPTGSTNPFVDYHVVYAIALIVFALASAGTTWGLGRSWARLTGNRRWLA